MPTIMASWYAKSTYASFPTPYVIEYEEDIYRYESRGGITQTARAIKARYTEGVVNHKGSGSAVLEYEEVCECEQSRCEIDGVCDDDRCKLLQRLIGEPGEDRSL